jgi:transcriptional antiterminator NusG
LGVFLILFIKFPLGDYMDESTDSNESETDVSDESTDTKDAQEEQENQKDSQNDKKKEIKKEVKDTDSTEQIAESTESSPKLESKPSNSELISLEKTGDEEEITLGVSDTKEQVQSELAPQSAPQTESQSEPSLLSNESDSEDKSLDFLELDTETREKMEEIEDAELKKEEEERLALEEAEFKESGIFAIKTSIGHEKMVANWLAIRARKRKLEVYAILSPPKLRGYLLLEGVKNKEALQDLIKGVQHARSVVDGSSSLDEIEHFLTPKPLVSGIEEGDVVEIIAGPFKGEKAKVTQIDESKEEITVELFEAMVSIPVTIRGDHVRILEKEAK